MDGFPDNFVYVFFLLSKDVLYIPVHISPFPMGLKFISQNNIAKEVK